MKNSNNFTFSKNKLSNQVRIIGGELRGQKIIFSDTIGLRPTGSRIKETLFNWINQDVKNSNCLDLFAGSGSLGIESASRGAKNITMIEKDHSAYIALKKSCSRLNLKSTTIIKADAITWLNENNIKEPFDIIFLDPPFMSNLIPMCCEILERGGLLSKPSYIYIEATRHQTTATVPKNWVLLRDNLAGQVAYKLYLRN